MAEKAYVTATEVNINTALQYQAANYYLRGQHELLKSMEGMNPFAMMIDMVSLEGAEGESLAVKKIIAETAGVTGPAAYIGELSDINLSEIEPGHWYFDANERMLVYIVNNREFFLSALPGRARIRYRVLMDYEDINENNQYDESVDHFRAMKLKKLDEYSWDI